MYRYSSFARYSIIDLANSKVYPLQPQQLRRRGLIDPQLFLRYATWNKQGNAIIYVHDNDIYLRPTPDAMADVRLTDDGEREAVFNGIPDWIYEGNIHSIRSKSLKEITAIVGCRGSAQFQQRHLVVQKRKAHGLRLF